VSLCRTNTNGDAIRARQTPQRSLRLLRHVIGRQRGAFAEKKVFHMFSDQVLRFLLPWHQTVLVEDHLHAFLPQLPGLRGDMLKDPLPKLTRPRRCIKALGQDRRRQPCHRLYTGSSESIVNSRHAWARRSAVST
jgi:hypothetical protein